MWLMRWKCESEGHWTQRIFPMHHNYRNTCAEEVVLIQRKYMELNGLQDLSSQTHDCLGVKDTVVFKNDVKGLFFILPVHDSPTWKCLISFETKKLDIETLLKHAKNIFSKIMQKCKVMKLSKLNYSKFSLSL